MESEIKDIDSIFRKGFIFFDEEYLKTLHDIEIN